MEELRVWAPQPAAVARSTPCDASRGDRTSAVGKDHRWQERRKVFSPQCMCVMSCKTQAQI